MGLIRQVEGQRLCALQQLQGHRAAGVPHPQVAAAQVHQVPPCLQRQRPLPAADGLVYRPVNLAELLSVQIQIHRRIGPQRRANPHILRGHHAHRRVKRHPAHQGIERRAIHKAAARIILHPPRHSQTAELPQLRRARRLRRRGMQRNRLPQPHLVSNLLRVPQRAFKGLLPGPADHIAGCKALPVWLPPSCHALDSPLIAALLFSLSYTRWFLPTRAHAAFP